MLAGIGAVTQGSASAHLQCKQQNHAYLSCVSGRACPFSRYGRMLLQNSLHTSVHCAAQTMSLDKPRRAWAEAARASQGELQALGPKMPNSDRWSSDRKLARLARLTPMERTSCH